MSIRSHGKGRSLVRVGAVRVLEWLALAHRAAGCLERGLAMNTLKTVLVHLDGSRAADGRLIFARDLAASLNARLDTAFAVSPRFLPLPIPAGDGIPPAPLLDEVDGRHLRHARAVHARVLGETASARWIDLSGADVTDRFVRCARVHDLVVLGQSDPADAESADVPRHWAETVILSSGVPILVVPWMNATQVNTADVVLVAWKSTAESARALATAWPMLHRAKKVHLAMAQEGTDAAGEANGVSGLLADHGVSQVHIHRDIPDAGAGDALLSLAGDCGANLLVMGCYGHSRAREWALGGTSRTILSSMTLPVWMAH